jgi:ATP-dependent Lon protease
LHDTKSTFDDIGTVTGLAFTTMGGNTTYIETQAIRRHLNNKSDDNNIVPRGGGGGTLKATGLLGDVMKESTSIAYTVARTQLSQIDPTNFFFENHDIHLHVPEGSTPKDGPSAGITMVTSLLSLAMGIPIPSSVAMTGEISLNGKVMPVGGIREKVMAAKRAGIASLLLPFGNQRDWDELPSYLKEEMQVQFVEDYTTIRDYILKYK